MTLNIPNSFVAGTKAKAEEVNANFTAVKNFCDNLETIAGTISTKVSKSGDTMTGNLIIPAGTASDHAVNKSQLDALAVVPVGTVLWFAANTPHTGFLKCNGDAVSRTTYANLFSVIGTTFGTGDGSTTFNLPDLRGEFIRGWDDSRGIDSGRMFGSTQTDMVGPHYHTYSKPALGSSGSDVHGDNPYRLNISSTNTGTNSGTETRPRNVALLAVIKY